MFFEGLYLYLWQTSTILATIKKGLQTHQSIEVPYSFLYGAGGETRTPTDPRPDC
jgi:hypothetical protein